MTTDMNSSRQFLAEKMITGSLLALTAMLICLFCAGTASASSDERYEQYSREEVKMYGVIDSMPDTGFTGKWVVGGRDVEVTDRTRIKEKYDRAATGRYVEVEGYRDKNNVLIAYEVEVERSRDSHSDRRAEEIKLYGTVEALPPGGIDGIWRVNGRDITVDRKTRIKEKHGRIAVGVYVEVEGGYSGDNFIAYEIETENRR